MLVCFYQLILLCVILFVSACGGGGGGGDSEQYGNDDSNNIGTSLYKASVQDLGDDIVLNSDEINGNNVVSGLYESSSGHYFDLVGEINSIGYFSLDSQNGFKFTGNISDVGSLGGNWVNKVTGESGEISGTRITSDQLKNLGFTFAKSCRSVLSDGVVYYCRDIFDKHIICPISDGFVESDTPCPTGNVIGICPSGTFSVDDGSAVSKIYSEYYYPESEVVWFRQDNGEEVNYKFYDIGRAGCPTEFNQVEPVLDVVRSCSRILDGNLLYCADADPVNMNHISLSSDEVECPQFDSTYQASSRYCPTDNRRALCPGGLLGYNGVLAIRDASQYWYNAAFEVPVDQDGNTFAYLTLGSCEGGAIDLKKIEEEQQPAISSGNNSNSTLSWGAVNKIYFESTGTTLPTPPLIDW